MKTPHHARHRKTFISQPDVDLFDEPGKAFPKLSRNMMERIARYGIAEQYDGGEYLFRVGDRNVDLFIVLEGLVDILESDGKGGHSLLTTHEPREFTGELDQLSGRAVLVCAKAVNPTSVLRITRPSTLMMARAEPDIGQMLLHAFILRRVGMVQHAAGGTVIVGSQTSSETLRIQSFLVRNGYPHRLIDTDEDPAAAHALTLMHPDAAEPPLVVLEGKTVLSRPSNQKLAEVLGISESLSDDHIYDVVVVGAGPAGLAAAVYSASEGLDTIVVEAFGPGGQAGTSSRIENYLGFPMGISGQGLASRAQVQAQKFGARLVVARAAQKLDCYRRPFKVELEDGHAISARAVVIASGARYRRLDIPQLSHFEGQGVHYAATALEARLCAGSEVVIVGGGNSAGQAAVFLSGRARHVHVLIRGDGLSETMSEYLVQRILDSSLITLHTNCQVTELIGDDGLSAVKWRCKNGEVVEQPVSNLFLMIGAVPNTDWLADCVALDRSGFVKTGHTPENPMATTQFVTSSPGIFAVGDVRADSVKRVASSVGEGSVVIHAIHGWLATLRAEAAEQPHDAGVCPV
ncbi:FAD-dependent oxidoreductase [Rhizobium johnstonii]|jgi:thioredoxin reductase (NADPH)|uniref:FAD-dependent oxidoreductase n=1 Tax=Rhizobium TaxID=379 RepID=UPI001FED2EB4|nr:FAD-dependent oxidoreductase [Rhizobium leguminosarum]